ncbi:hypothetical protein FRC09_015955 [Ceratobasidium sp. 395]|nr:hypothetical protein FRC09_015955 [Ceratobasidium sp. 395]
MLASSLALAALSYALGFTYAVPTEQHYLEPSLGLIPVQHTLGTHVKIGYDGTYEHISVTSFPNHKIRVQSVKNLCDSSVKQYSGYLDVSKHKHLFFWFFESRKDPHKAPLAAWMNGGPGGSSAVGLLMENGPCNIQPGGNSTGRNPYGWNEVTNMFFLDQPAGVGYSYSTSHIIDTTAEAAEDFYAFIQLFLTRFPEYSQRPFHVLAESYGGQYAPNFANYINRQNKAHAFAAFHQHINLESVVIVNGLVSPEIQGEMTPEYACRGPYAFWDNNGEHCAKLRSRVPRMHELMQISMLNRFTNHTELLYQKLGRNRFDVRKKCNDPAACYHEMGWAQEYLNSTDVKVALGIPGNYNYSWYSSEIEGAFVRAADIANDASPMIRELVEDGVRVLNLAGDADFGCNFMATFEWMYRLDNPYAKEFRSMNNSIWRNKDGKAVGEVRAAGDNGGKTAGVYTWMRVYESGHMVPHDQPEVSLQFFDRWINNKPITG